MQQEVTPTHAAEISNSTVAICAIARNEGPYIREWIDYHMGIGADKIFIYDNSEKEPEYVGLQSEYPGHVVVRPWKGENKQVDSYNDCLNRLRNDDPQTAVGFIDIDEFVVLKKHANLKNFLAQHLTEGVIALNWYIFGSGEEVKYRDAPVTQRFVWRAEKVNQHVKSFGIAKDIQLMGIHQPQLIRPGSTQHDTSGKVKIIGFNFAFVDNDVSFHYDRCSLVRSM